MTTCTLHKTEAWPNEEARPTHSVPRGHKEGRDGGAGQGTSSGRRPGAPKLARITCRCLGWDRHETNPKRAAATRQRGDLGSLAMFVVSVGEVRGGRRIHRLRGSAAMQLQVIITAGVSILGFWFSSLSALLFGSALLSLCSGLCFCCIGQPPRPGLMTRIGRYDTARTRHDTAQQFFFPSLPLSAGARMDVVVAWVCCWFV